MSRRFLTLLTALALAPLPVAGEVVVRPLDLDSFWRPDLLQDLRTAARARPKAANTGTDFACPYRFSPSGGRDTLLAVWNTSTRRPESVDISYTDLTGKLISVRTVNLDPAAVATFSVRRVPGLPTEGGVFVQSAFSGGITVDCLEVVPELDAAIGENGWNLRQLCPVVGGRILAGGSFEGSSAFDLYVENPQGADDDINPATLFVFFFEESTGTVLEAFAIWLTDIFSTMDFFTFARIDASDSLPLDLFGSVQIFGNGPGVGAELLQPDAPEQVQLTGNMTWSSTTRFNVGLSMVCPGI